MKEKEIIDKLNAYRNNGKRMFASSSFQSHSIVMLHILSRYEHNIPIYFINTGYHFPETLAYKNKIAEYLGIQIIDLYPTDNLGNRVDSRDQLLYKSDPDTCCYISKVKPVEPLLNVFDVWINGIRSEQNRNRSTMKLEEQTKFKSVRYHPMLNWTNEEIQNYISKFSLPEHPLAKKGYISIGCKPCTKKPVNDDARSGRWSGFNKTECGLNTDLILSRKSVEPSIFNN